MSYFHSFTPGFNWVYVVAPLVLAVLAWLGFRFGASIKMQRKLFINRVYGAAQYNVCVANEKGVLRVNACSDSLDKIIGTVAGLAVCYMLLTECSLGLIQWFDNSLGPNDSPFWGLFMGMAAIVFATMAYATLAAAVFHAAKAYKCKRVKMAYGRRYKVVVVKTRNYTEITQIICSEIGKYAPSRATSKRAGR